MSLEYSPVVLESIKAETFPPVALFLKQGKQFVLYKDKGTEISDSILANLRNSKVSHVFVRTSDFDSLHSYFEENLESIFDGDAISVAGKNLVLCSAMVTYIGEVYQNPHRMAPYHNCRKLLERFNLRIADRDELLDLLDSVSKSEVYLFTHCAQVTILTMKMHQQLFDSSHRELVEVGLGAMLHDIGMLNVSHNILSKCDALDENEYYRIKEHVKEGNQNAINMGIRGTTTLDIILRHHERFDGRGYPGSLSSGEIPKSAQVAAICDVFSALVNDRPYRQASSIPEALDTMRGESSLFNPEYLETFEHLLRP